jgi:hypothetical protein
MGWALIFSTMQLNNKMLSQPASKAIRSISEVDRYAIL